MTHIYAVKIPDPKTGEPRLFGFWSEQEAASFARGHDIDDAPVIVVVMPYDNN